MTRRIYVENFTRKPDFFHRPARLSQAEVFRGYEKAGRHRPASVHDTLERSN